MPPVLAAVVISLVCVFHILLPSSAKLQFFRELEWKTYDWRMRQAAHSKDSVATNLGFVFISDDSIAAVNDGSLGYRYGLYWPRQLYGRVIEELAAQQAKAVAFDVIFPELRPDHAPVESASGDLIESDDYFSQACRASGNAILASTPTVMPPQTFRTNCWALGDISAGRESDGILRRAKAYYDYRIWHPLMLQISREAGFDLNRGRFEKEGIVFALPDGSRLPLYLGSDGLADLNRFVADITEEPQGNTLPAIKPFEVERVWQMGIALAARELDCDLSHVRVDNENRRVVLDGKRGRREIPVELDGSFYIDWSLKPTDKELTVEPIESLLEKHNQRAAGEASESRFANKLVVIGSTATGNDLTDRGATPLEKDTFLVSKHWNIANSVLTGRFVTHSPLWINLVLIVAAGVLSALLTWKLRAIAGIACVLIAMAAYLAVSAWLAVEFRLWIPVLSPVTGGLLITHVSMVAWRARYEQREKRRIKSVFNKMVSPNVVQELLRAENLSLGGARREITIFFADIRGFTEMTDTAQAKAEEFVEKSRFSAKAAEDYYARTARDTLDTVNLYLGAIADIIKKHDGTLDKYIGDCVMAFWGAPTANDQHALYAVRAAVEAQRAIHALNEARARENERRDLENISRAATGQEPLPLLPLLALGSGINTGVAIVGLMGSDSHTFNYTVFGREVNLASRLEGVSGRGRIIIGEGTYLAILRDDPKLAATCVELPAVTVKGIRNAVAIYEVPWKKTSLLPQSEIPPTTHAAGSPSERS